MHRSEEKGIRDRDMPPPLPDGADPSGVQWPDDGAGPLFRRVYRTRVRGHEISPEALIERVSADPDAVSPSEFASFWKSRGKAERMDVGDEFLVRMPGPWNGPVRVVLAEADRFRYVTLQGHLEAGQIEFASHVENGTLVVAIESWSRPGDRLSELLHNRLRMAKEVQLHMWTSVLERIADLSGGAMAGGVEIRTRRVELPEGS
jgi:Domain of unknown function (DUF1990)